MDKTMIFWIVFLALISYFLGMFVSFTITSKQITSCEYNLNSLCILNNEIIDTTNKCVDIIDVDGTMQRLSKMEFCNNRGLNNGK